MDFLARSLQHLLHRPAGPLSFRFLLQPAVATLLAIRAGLKDARTDRPAYLWTLLSDPAKRYSLVLEGWRDIAKVFVLAVAIDVVYQLIMLRWLYPLQALIVGTLVAIVPYILVRGLVMRLARIIYARQQRPHAIPKPGPFM